MSKREKTIVLVTVTAIIVLIIIVGILIWKGLPGKEVRQEKKQEEQSERDLIKKQGREASEKTQRLIDEVRAIADKIKEQEGDLSEIVIIEDEEGEETKAVIIGPGSGAISVETGDVLTIEGKIAKNSAVSGSRDAPQVSFPIDNPEDLPESTIRLEITANSITPSEFTVSPLQTISLALTVKDDRGHIFRFEDSDLSAIAAGLSPGMTKTVSFNAPEAPGEYVFFSDISDYREKGAVGKMIVK